MNSPLRQNQKRRERNEEDFVKRFFALPVVDSIGGAAVLSSSPSTLRDRNLLL
jgi:hypothetical protein